MNHPNNPEVTVAPVTKKPYHYDVLVSVESDKPIKDVTDAFAGRLWSMDGVRPTVTAKLMGMSTPEGKRLDHVADDHYKVSEQHVNVAEAIAAARTSPFPHDLPRVEAALRNESVRKTWADEFSTLQFYKVELAESITKTAQEILKMTMSKLYGKTGMEQLAEDMEGVVYKPARQAWGGVCNYGGLKDDDFKFFMGIENAHPDADPEYVKTAIETTARMSMIHEMPMDDELIEECVTHLRSRGMSGADLRDYIIRQKAIQQKKREAALAPATCESKAFTAEEVADLHTKLDNLPGEPTEQTWLTRMNTAIEAVQHMINDAPANERVSVTISLEIGTTHVSIDLE